MRFELTPATLKRKMSKLRRIYTPRSWPISPYQLALPGILDDMIPIKGMTHVEAREVAPITIEGCRRLWAAVLSQAIRAFVKDQTDRRGKAKEEDSKLWLMDDDEYVGSFSYACRVLDMDPESVRRRVVDMTEWGRNENL